MTKAECFLKLDYNKYNKEKLREILLNFGNPEELKILYLSTYFSDYIRTETMLQLFNDINVNVKKAIFDNQRFKYIKALTYFLKHKKNYDVIFIAFRGHEILPIIKLFTKKPVVFDAFVSIYDTLCFDRKIFRHNSFIGKLLRRYERCLCRMSNTVLVDTKAHKEYFEAEFGAKNIDYIYVGCNENLFRPLDVEKNKDQFVVLWYGSTRPLHGIDVILKTAKLLEDEEIRFKLIGPIRKKYSKLIKSLNLKNTEFINYVPYDKLSTEINKADICLGGHFSDRDKAKRVIAGKTFQFLACQRPTILGDNIANNELFEEKALVHFVKMNDPEKLADKIREIKRK